MAIDIANGVFQLHIAIAIAKTIPKLLLITSFFYMDVSASQTGLEGYKKDICGLKQSNIYLRVLHAVSNTRNMPKCFRVQALFSDSLCCQQPLCSNSDVTH